VPITIVDDDACLAVMLRQGTLVAVGLRGHKLLESSLLHGVKRWRGEVLPSLAAPGRVFGRRRRHDCRGLSVEMRKVACGPGCWS